MLAKGPEVGSKTPAGGEAFDEVVSAGVTFLKVGPATTVWTQADVDDALANDRAAAARGIQTWVNLATLSRATAGSAQDTRLHDVVAALKGDASAGAIGMWKGADEPWWSGIAASSLQFVYCLATSRGTSSWCAGEAPVDSDHLWVTIQAPKGTASDLAPYSTVTDVHGVDHYPVTLANADPNLHGVGTWTATLGAATPNHAVWTTLQVCASGSSDGSGSFVLPNRLQERYMIYDAILNGARNLAFYGGNIPGCWNASDTAAGWNWTFWDGVLKPLVQEINAGSPIAPALLNPGTTRTLASSDATTQAIVRDGVGSDDLWVIAARSGAGSQAVTIDGLPATVTSGAVYTEGRSVPVVHGSFTDTFGRWDVHVYHFTVPPPPPGGPVVTSFAPVSGPAGTAVTITGSKLTGATAVAFAGTTALYTVDSDTRITATVPAGAADGPISVTTTAGSTGSQDSFDVTSPASGGGGGGGGGGGAPTPPPAPAPQPTPAPPRPVQAPVLRLLAGRVAIVPAPPRAGRLLTVRLGITRSNGTAVRSGRVTCTGKVGGRSLRAVAHGWSRGRAFCSWRLPVTARGKTFRGVVRVTNGSGTAARAFARLVRGA